MQDLQSPQPLMIVGFLKCGTTSLSRHLADHPEIATPIAKELYYFLDEGSSLTSMQNVINKLAFNRDVKSDGIDFEDYFPDRSDARYLMEATPFSYSQQAALSYAKDHPGARVIFMLRDPSKRLLSSFRFFQGMYQEFPVSTFDEFVNALLDIGTREAYRARIPKPFFRELFDSEVEMGYYAKHIRRWTTVLGPEQVYVGTMERLRDEANTVMAEICTFLDLPSTVSGAPAPWFRLDVTSGIPSCN